MNPVEKLIWHHDLAGNAESFTLTKDELYAIGGAAYADAG